VLTLRTLSVISGLLLSIAASVSRGSESLFLLTDAVDWQSAVAQVERQQWRSLSNTIPTSSGETWIYLDLSQSSSRILHLGSPFIFDYKLYPMDSPDALYHGGLYASKESRVIFHPEFLLPMGSAMGERLLLRVESRPGFQIPINFLTTNQVSRLNAIRFLGDGMYYGGMLLMFVFALCVAAFKGGDHAGRLALTILAWLFTMVTGSGYGNLLIWPGSPQLMMTMLPVALCLASIASAWFSWRFLRTAAQGSPFLSGIRFLLWLNIATLFLVVLFDFADALARYNILALSVPVICTAIVGMVRGDRASRYLVVSALLAAVPIALVPIFPAAQNYYSVTGTLSLIAVVVAVMSRLAVKIQNRKIEAQVVASRAQFLAAMSHEIRTPLNGVIGFSELCAAEPLTGAVASYVSQIQRSSKLLLSVVNEVLDYSKLEANAVVVQLTAMSVPDTLENLVSTLSPVAKANNVQVEVSVADTVAPYVITDPNRCGQVLMNLLSNAIKFSENGRVKVKVYHEFGRLMFQVSDNGIGIPKAALDLLFDPYKQVNAATAAVFGGTGLGLSIAKQFAELIGGTIKVQSKVGVGSVFTLQIPYEATAAVEPAKKETCKIDFTGLNVLLVEDNSVNQLLASTILSKEGVVVDQASNGRTAIDKAKGKSYDLIFMDVQMPEVNGIEATVALRGSGCITPIIALTASSSEPQKLACKQAGMNDFLTKPFLKHELLGKLGQWAAQLNSKSESEV
jgi:signal transduction histidine kinase/CheY-like chemotaxis protein